MQPIGVEADDKEAVKINNELNLFYLTHRFDIYRDSHRTCLLLFEYC